MGELRTKPQLVPAPVRSHIGGWLALIRLLADGHGHSVRELATAMGTSTRNFYYALEALRQAGINLLHRGRSYALDPRSPFWNDLAGCVDFTHDEAAYLHRLLIASADPHALADGARSKLERFYDLPTDEGARLHHQQFVNTEQLERAMAMRRVVILHGYASPHSRSIADRVVEPFLFQGDKADVRAYEIKSHQNKTFKIARIGQVEVVDTPWFNEASHREVFTDLFMFSGEERHAVSLRLSLLAYRLLLEEYPQAAGKATLL